MPCQSCKQLFDKTGSLGAGLYTIRPAASAFSVYCTSDGYTKVLRATTISQYQGSGSVGSSSAAGSFKLSDAQISQILSATPGAGMKFKCGSYWWEVPDWKASGIDNCTPAQGCSTYSPGAWQMQYPPRGTGWYQGYSIGKTYAINHGTALETRLSNAYGTGYKACRVHNVGDFDFAIWVMA